MRKHFVPFGILLVVVGLTATNATAQLPPDSTVRALLEERVRDGRSAGLVVGLLEPDGSTRFVAAGEPGPGRTLDRQSVFEIGSITKVFTGVLLADMVLRGVVGLDDPVGRYLPDSVEVPAHDGKQITLEHLATQTSGLPRLPSNLRPADPLNPYADYTVAQLYAFLGGYTLPREPGAQYDYSNLGFGLLGHVLALRAGTSYEELVSERILQPLDMTHTAITLTPWMREHVVAGHNANGDTVPLWDLPTFAGAGAIRSNAEDMLKFAAAALNGGGPVHDAIDLAVQPRAQAGSPQSSIGLGWHRLAAGGDTIVWHNGGTGGFRTFLGIRPATGTAVVLLTNTGGAGADDLARHLLNPMLPLAPTREVVDLPETVLRRYTGTYEIQPQLRIVVTLVDSALRAQVTGQTALRLWPASETTFFYRDVEAEITFQVDAAGAVTGLILHQNGRDVPARRIGG